MAIKAVTKPDEAGTRAIVKGIFGWKYYAWTAGPAFVALSCGAAAFAARDTLYLPIAGVIALTVGVFALLGFRRAARELYREASKKGDVTEFVFEEKSLSANGQLFPYNSFSLVKKVGKYIVFRLISGGCFSIAEKDFREGSAQEALACIRAAGPEKERAGGK